MHHPLDPRYRPEPAIAGAINHETPWLIPADMVLRLWRSGRDTLDIARLTGTTESVICRLLPLVLKAAREDQEWNFDRTSTG
jgi:hypothetical protein